MLALDATMPCVAWKNLCTTIAYMMVQRALLSHLCSMASMPAKNARSSTCSFHAPYLRRSSVTALLKFNAGVLHILSRDHIRPTRRFRNANT